MVALTIEGRVSPLRDPAVDGEEELAPLGLAADG